MQNPQAGGFPAFSPIFLIGYIPLIYGAVVGAMLIYKMWAAIQDGRARTTPGMAVGLMFVPCFNIYWMFQVYWGWTKDYNLFIDREGLNVPRMNENIALTICILTCCSVIPCLGALAGLANMVLMIMFLNSAIDGVNALAGAGSAAD